VREQTLADLESLAAEEGASFISAAMMVNECVADPFDRAGTEQRLAELAGRYDDRITPWKFLQEEGFGGQPPEDVVAGSRLDRVLESRCGLPITLAALIAFLAEESGQEARGINFPGHFLVRVGQALVDPYRMVSGSKADFLASLPEGARSGNPFAAARTPDILLRMFNNLKYHFVAVAEFHRALEMVDCQLRVLPTSAALLFEQGEFWLRLGSVQGARFAFEQLVAGEDAAVAAMAQRRLAEIGDRQDTVH
jgi:regulator of sirC expression with transglutaminase-like and TPR domain